MVTGINHITLSVKDLSVSFEFYKNTLGFKPLMRNQKSAYFLAGDLWICIEQDPSVRAGELPEYTHLAFSVAAIDFAAMNERIRHSGAAIFKDNKSEGDSVYFLDPNGHKLEIHVGDWQSRLKNYKERSIPGMEFFV